MIELIIAFGAGFISFLSPCVLPLIPGYISYVSGQSLQQVIISKRGQGRGYSGIENPLFFKDNSRMLYGDAKESLDQILSQVSWDPWLNSSKVNNIKTRFYPFSVFDQSNMLFVGV